MGVTQGELRGGEQWGHNTTLDHILTEIKDIEDQIEASTTPSEADKSKLAELKKRKTQKELECLAVNHEIAERYDYMFKSPIQNERVNNVTKILEFENKMHEVIDDQVKLRWKHILPFIKKVHTTTKEPYFPEIVNNSLIKYSAPSDVSSVSNVSSTSSTDNMGRYQQILHKMVNPRQQRKPAPP